MDWNSVRDRIELDPSIAYLNTGTSGLVPKSVHAASIQSRTRLHHNPTDYVWRSMHESLWNSRERLAQHLSTSPERLIFFQNVSHAINTFCVGLDLPPDSEILLSDHEYAAMRWAWDQAAALHRWKIVVCEIPHFPYDEERFVSRIHEHISPQTRVIYLSHILYTTGIVLPIARICQFARQRGILTFIDGAHGPGMVPLALDALGADFYAANLHKWFLAEVGAAFLFVAPGCEDWIAPWQVSWGYRDDRSTPHLRNQFGSTAGIRRFEMEGTRDITPWHLLPLNCDFLESIGYEALRRRHHELSESVGHEIDQIGGLQLITSRERSQFGGITSFQIPTGIDGQSVRQRLWEDHRIEINVLDWNNQQFLRVSTHIYNTFDEIERLAKGLRGLLASRSISRIS